MPSGAKKRKKEKAAAKRREDEEMSINQTPTSTSPSSPTNPQDKELEQGLAMESSGNDKVASSVIEKEVEVKSSEGLVIERSENDKVSSPSIEKEVEVKSSEGLVIEKSENDKVAPPLIEKEVESSKGLVGATQISISSVEDVGIVEEVVEGKREVIEDSVCEMTAEVVLEHRLSEEGEVDPVAKQLLEASEAQDSVPTSSLVYESEEGNECGGVPNMGTIIAITPTEDTEGRPPLSEHRASLWNCCGLFDAFRSSRG